MAGFNSPGVKDTEIDLTTVVGGTSESIAAYAGEFFWGPIEEEILVSDEDVLGAYLGQPKASYATTPAELNRYATSFLTAASYLAYADALRISRVANTNDIVTTNNAANAVSTLTANDTPVGVLVKNDNDFHVKDANASFATQFLIAKYAGALGNSIGVSAVFTAEQYSSSVILNSLEWTLDKDDNGVKSLSVDITNADPVPAALSTIFAIGDFVEFTHNGVQYRNIVKSIPTTTKVNLEDIGASVPFFPSSASEGVVTGIKKIWRYAAAVNGAPSTNEFHLVLTDTTGFITGEVGTVLQTHAYLSTDISKTNADGTTAYYKTVLNDTSPWVWAGGASLTSQLNSVSKATFVDKMTGGNNGTAPAQDDYINAYSIFANPETVDIAFIIAPPLAGNIANNVVPNYLIQNIAEVRKDCVVYLSPRYDDVVNKPKQERANVKAFRNTLTSTSYGFLDSGWKYMYDKYNNTFRWVPLCADTTGTAARTDDERDSWWSHAGFNRGVIKNVVRLAWNPTQAERDDIYPVGINPVVTFNGSGTLLYGDKTLLDRPSAFDRINVRRLFIVLRKKIREAAKYSLFEFNDEFTRARFVSIVEPFLRDIQARRGITAFKVVCDDTNNTAQVIDTNRFIGDTYVKANRSINFIELRFINTPTGIDFDEIVGKF